MIERVDFDAVSKLKYNLAKLDIWSCEILLFYFPAFLLGGGGRMWIKFVVNMAMEV